MNIYAVLAELVSIIHFAIIAFVVLGQVAILIGWGLRWRWIRNPWFRVAHVGTIVIVAVEAMVEFECPLTTLEYNLQIEAGQLDPDFRNQNWSDDDFGFISRHLRKFTFYDASKHGVVLDASYYVFAGLTLATVFLVPPRFRRQLPTTQEVSEPRPSGSGRR